MTTSISVKALVMAAIVFVAAVAAAFAASPDLLSDLLSGGTVARTHWK